MLDPGCNLPVSSDEFLARYILFSKHIRPSDHTVKPDAFMPHPHTDLSLTRHIQATPEELWYEGGRVAALRNLHLYGRADALVTAFTDQTLTVVAAPILENPNHANAKNWPAEKPNQKIKALLIADRSQFTLKPT